MPGCLMRDTQYKVILRGWARSLPGSLHVDCIVSSLEGSQPLFPIYGLSDSVSYCPVLPHLPVYEVGSQLCLRDMRSIPRGSRKYNYKRPLARSQYAVDSL